jgi:hypothetical protein
MDFVKVVVDITAMKRHSAHVVVVFVQGRLTRIHHLIKLKHIFTQILVLILNWLFDDKNPPNLNAQYLNFGIFCWLIFQLASEKIRSFYC